MIGAVKVCRQRIEPVLGVLRSFGLILRRGVLRCVVCIWVRASPTRMRPAEGGRPLPAETVWQQTLFVQIHLWVGTAHLTAHRDANITGTHSLYFFKTPVRGYNTDNRKAVNIASPSYIQTNTQVTHVECWQPTQIKAIFESLETSPLLVTVKTCLLHLNITIWHYLTTDWTNKNGNGDNLLKSIWKVVHLRVLKVF